MHKEAYNWIAKQVTMLPIRRSILEFGSKNVNGTCRNLFSNADIYLGIDVSEGDSVDIVADAAVYRSVQAFDTVLCFEVLEHTDNARELCRNAHRHLSKHGVFIVTAAAPGREPHSAIDGGQVRENEFYRNVTVSDLRWWCSDFSLVMVDMEGQDVYAIAIR